MKVAFISGPYRSKTVNGIIQNIRAAEAVALKYWKLGYAAICPHKNTSLFDGVCDDSVWLNGDIELLKRSDTVVMMKKWKESSGAIAEHGVALKLNKEIIYE